jgi:hybrid cluster-associated redox disulfide protein
MAVTNPTSDMTVAEVLEQWPKVVSVFQEYKTACVGCSMAPFDTMVDVAREYDLSLLEFMAALDRAVNGTGVTGEAPT